MRTALALILSAGLAACSAPESDPREASALITDAAETQQPDGEDAGTAETGAEAAAPAPGSDIYLYALTWTDGQPALGAQRGIIGEPGYDNQPFFTSGGALLFTSAGANGNTDIWRHNLASGALEQLTDTPDASEYSPKTPPGEAALSYLYQPPGGYAGNAYLADEGNGDPRAAHALAPVGYYEFSTDMRHVATFYLGEPESGEPFTLQLIDRSTTPETIVQIAENPGRTFWRNPRGTGVYHTIGDAEGHHTIHYLDFETGEDTALFALPDGSQDFVSHGLPDDSVAFLASHDGALLFWTGERWNAIADLAARGLTGVTRLAISPDGGLIAIVADDAPAP